MPYLSCPHCGMLAHVATDRGVVIQCPRCRALQREVRLVPLEQIAAEVASPLERQPKPAT